MLYLSGRENAEKYIDLVLALTALSHRELGSFEVYANSSGRPTPDLTALELDRTARELEQVFAGIPGHGGEYLRRSLKAVRTHLDIVMGRPVPYSSAAENVLGFVPAPVSEEKLLALTGLLDEELAAAGYAGSTLAERTASFYRSGVISPDDLIPTAQRYLGLLREQSRKLLPLPEDEGLAGLDGVNDAVWAALSSYKGGYKTGVTFNLGSTWRLPSFVDTIAHELYPGHHCWYSIREELIKKGQLPFESSVEAVCMADNLIFEGAPESGLHFLGIDDPARSFAGLDRALQEKIILVRKIIRCVRILQVNSCLLYHLNGVSREDAIAYMCRFGLVSRGTAERVFRYFSHPVNGIYYPSYYFGRELVTAAYDSVRPGQRGEFFSALYGEAHTTATFLKRMEELTGSIPSSFRF